MTTQAPTIRLGDASPAVVTDEQENEFDQAESGSSSSRLAPSRMPVPYDEDDEDDDNDGESAMIPKDGDELPVSHEIIMKDHTKVCICLVFFLLVVFLLTSYILLLHLRRYLHSPLIHPGLESSQDRMITMPNYGTLEE